MRSAAKNLGTVAACSIATAAYASPIVSNPMTGEDLVVWSSWDADNAALTLHVAPADVYAVSISLESLFESAEMPLGALVHITGVHAELGPMSSDGQSSNRSPILTQSGQHIGVGVEAYLSGSEVFTELVLQFDQWPDSEEYVSGCTCQCPRDINCDGVADNVDEAIIALLLDGVDTTIIMSSPDDSPFPAGSAEAVSGIIQPTLDPCDLPNPGD